jgi:hypothetical protein
MRLLARRPDGTFVAPFEQGEIGPLHGSVGLLRPLLASFLMGVCTENSNPDVMMVKPTEDRV